MKTKNCIKCRIEKTISEFHKNKTRKDGYSVYCKSCKVEYIIKYGHKQKIKEYNKKYNSEHKEQAKKYQNENKQKIKEQKKKYYNENKQEKREYQLNYDKLQIKDNPWKSNYKNAKSRCNNPNNDRYKRYGGRGIKVLMTIEDFKFLWFRDKAYNMKKPSIDRKDNDGHYILENCQFMEFRKNVAKMMKRRFAKIVSL